MSDWLLKLIAEEQEKHGYISQDAITAILATKYPADKIQGELIKLLRQGVLLDGPVPGTFVTEAVVEETVFWFDPEKLPWTEIMPKSYASRKKGPYQNTPENKKNPIYKGILEQIMTPDNSGVLKYRAIINGIVYWVDQYNGGISRRKSPPKEEAKDIGKQRAL